MLVSNLSKIRSLFYRTGSAFASPSKGKICLTTPIFYVNSEPHIGHLYSMIYTDAIAKWKRIDGYDVIFSTGTDEHGQKIQNAAKAKNISEIEHCDKYASKFRELAQKSDVNYDVFIRTTEERHAKAVHSIWNTLYNNGNIYEASHEGWYCVAEETFVNQRELIQDPNNSDRKLTPTGYPVEWVSEDNYKFRFTEYKDRLLAYFKNQDPVKPQSFQEFLNDETAGIQEISVSRPKSRIKWGIEAPNNKDHTIYVWLDALTNYLTVINYPFEKDSEGHQYAENLVHVIGKDILKFHGVYWPAFLMAANLPLPKKIVVHNHWLKDNRKMSKSLGNVVEPFGLIQNLGINAVRYYFLKEGPEDFDTNFEIEELVNKYNDLVQGLVNLIMRITSPKVLKNQTISSVTWELSEVDREYIKHIEELVSHSQNKYNHYDIRAALEPLPKIWDLTNKLTSQYEPWKMKDDVKNREKVVYLVLESVRILSILVYPCLNNLMRNVNAFLNISPENIRTDKLRFRIIQESTKDNYDNFSFEKQKDYFLKVDLSYRDKVFQNKLSLEPDSDKKKASIII